MNYYNYIFFFEKSKKSDQKSDLLFYSYMEQATGLEPATSSLARKCSSQLNYACIIILIYFDISSNGIIVPETTLTSSSENIFKTLYMPFVWLWPIVVSVIITFAIACRSRVIRFMGISIIYNLCLSFVNGYSFPSIRSSRSINHCSLLSLKDPCCDHIAPIKIINN